MQSWSSVRSPLPNTVYAPPPPRRRSGAVAAILAIALLAVLLVRNPWDGRLQRRRREAMIVVVAMVAVVQPLSPSAVVLQRLSLSYTHMLTKVYIVASSLKVSANR